MFGGGLQNLKKRWKVETEKEATGIEITGFYYADETNSTRARNLGLARAEEIKKALKTAIPEEKIRISSAVKSEAFGNDYKAAYLIKSYTESKNAPWKEGANELTIFFTREQEKSGLLTEELSTKLTAIAQEMKTFNLGANIIAHTAKTNNGKKDYELGKSLADKVLDFLVSRGVNKDELRATSMGSTQSAEDGLDRRIRVIFSSNK